MPTLPAFIEHNNSDYIICNGSGTLINDIKSAAPFGEHVLNIGFFTTHFARQERQQKKAFVPGAVQINLSTDWLSRGSLVFQNVVNGLCYTVNSEEDLYYLLAAPPNNGLREYLYGNDQTDILGKIEAAIAEIADAPKLPGILRTH